MGRDLTRVAGSPGRWRDNGCEVDLFSTPPLLQALPLAATQEGSEALLAETQAAQNIESHLGGSLDFSSIHTSLVRGALGGISSGVAVSGPQAWAVASCLQAALALRKAISATAANGKNAAAAAALSPLIEMVTPMATHPELVNVILDILEDDGVVKDTASSELRKARVQVRTIKSRLQDLLNRIMRSGAGSTVQEVVELAGRMCVIVAAETRTSVPGLLLQSGAGGASMYIEPTAAVPLNNELASAKEDEAKSELAVLDALSLKLRKDIDDIQFVLDTVVKVDVVVARARYSSWLGATRPSFSSLETLDSQDKDGLVVDLRRLRHPLLLQQHRENLRKAKERVAAKAKAASRARARVGGEAALVQALAASEAAQAEVEVLGAQTPVPIDICVKSQTKVVAITGPNTGGKTAAIKTLGLAALMAKAGLYVLAAEPARLPSFDLVLADIGDEQSLTQSLSTFSSHIRRIKMIKAESTVRSLVLLDEVGTGTDPVEGAALGMALLESFADSSLLTLATTHHGELKTLKYSDPRFENASVAFDEERLQPTFRLLWGIPGRSNALNIAGRLGLPSHIVQDARVIHGAASVEVNEAIMGMEEAKARYDGSTEEAEKLLREAQVMHQELVAAAARLQQQEARLLFERADLVAAAAAEARSRLGSILREAQVAQLGSGSASSGTTTESGAVRADQVEVALSGGGAANGHGGGLEDVGRVTWRLWGSSYRDIGQRVCRRHDARHTLSSDNLLMIGHSNAGGSGAPAAALPTEHAFAVGDKVFVAKLNAVAEVVGVNAARRQLTVQAGPLQLKVNFVEALAGAPGSHAAALRQQDDKTGFAGEDDQQPRTGAGGGWQARRSAGRAAAAAQRLPEKTADNTVDVRGMYAEDAQEEVGRELARLRRQGEVAAYIVHGVGSGKLRAVLQPYMRMHSDVRSVEPAPASYGGEGTTIAHLL
eukprot:SM000011S19056  [mRNA]  locus=s11:655516:663035:+ [translate_table: standard]